MRHVGVVLDGVVPYVKGGIAYGGGTGDVAGETDSQVHVGWTVGAGVEVAVAVADNISVFAEYNHYALGEKTYNFPEIPASVDVSSEIHAVKAGLNFSF